MSRSIIPDNQIIIAIDTTVMRSLCYEKPSWVDCFKEMSIHGYHFCLSDVLFYEIVNQFERKSISGAEWKQCIEQLTKFISSALPILPFKGLLWNMAGIKPEKVPYNNFDPQFQRKYSKALWHYLSAATDAKYLTESFIFIYNGKKYIYRLKSGEAQKNLEAERDRWIKFINSYDEISKDKLFFEIFSDKDNIIKEQKQGLDSLNEGTPPMSVRADMLLKYMFKKIAERTKLKTPYNPTKNKNDGIDFLLIFTFLLPALICTKDTTFINKLRALNSYQSSWVYTPEEIENTWHSKTLVKPLWPK